MVLNRSPDEEEEEIEEERGNIYTYVYRKSKSPISPQYVFYQASTAVSLF